MADKSDAQQRLNTLAAKKSLKRKKMEMPTQGSTSSQNKKSIRQSGNDLVKLSDHNLNYVYLHPDVKVNSNCGMRMEIASTN